MTEGGGFYDVGDLEEKLPEVEDPLGYKPPLVINSKSKNGRKKADPLGKKMI